jgi:protease-4
LTKALICTILDSSDCLLKEEWMKIGKLEITWELVRPVLLWIALPLVLGLLIAAAIPRPVIGVIHLDVAIDSYSAGDLIAQIDYARQQPQVRAVVLLVDSPGGTVADTESVYQELLLLRQAKPVVTSIGAMAASGAYYLSVGTDYIIADPTSEVGNIGVIGYLPDNPSIYEGIVSTGPYKLWGEPRDTFQREMEMVKQSFYQAVQLGRGENLKAGQQIVLSGRIWLGSEALGLGLIDKIGSQSDAMAMAAKLARIRNYQVVGLAGAAGVQTGSFSSFAQSVDGVITLNPDQTGIFLLYIPPIPMEK